MEIRILTSNDVKEYRKLRLEALQRNPNVFANTYEEELKQSTELYENRFNAPTSVTFGAFVDNKICGNVTLVQETLTKLKHRANIVAMYVDPEQRGSGIGKALLTRAVETAREMKEIEQLYLMVASENTAAIKLYSSLGFESYCTEKRSLKVGNTYIDEQHMVLFLV